MRDEFARSQRLNDFPPHPAPRRHVTASTRLARLLVILSTFSLESATADGERSSWLIASILVGEIAAMLIAGGLVRRCDSRQPAKMGASPLVSVLLLAFVPLVAEIVLRRAADSMLPLELILLAGYRNVVLALGAFAHRPGCQRLAASLSTFLTIFASALSNQLWLHGLVVVFAVVGIWWLMGTYWESLRGRLAAASEQSLSRRWLIALPLLVMIPLLGVPVAATQTGALRGFLPSSGGSDWYDPAARSGIGDGDALVAGTDNIQSFAPIEDAPFLNSHDPSLYDLFDESYNEPVKPRSSERAIALPKSLAANQKQHHIAESKQAGRQFSTLRQQREGARQKIKSLDTAALFYVKGRVPLHLKLESFDRYDGIDWHPEELRVEPPPLAIQTQHDRPWLRLGVADNLDLYAAPETHALKIAHVDTNRIPAPVQLLGVHIDQVDQADFFAWAQPGIVRMDREKLPALTVMHLQSRVVDERRVAQAAPFWSAGPPEYRHFGDDFDSRQVRELAARWTDGVSPGQSQVRAIVSKLREHYIHDRDARPPADCLHTAAHFLLSARRGPDYQFATAAVVLLRSLGISARVVSGFHVDPARYDARARHTPVLKEDVHFWAEVAAGGGHWIPIEPTPGYELLEPPPTLGEQVWNTLLAAGRFVMQNAVALSLLLAASVALWRARLRVMDLAATACWKLIPAHDDRRFVRQTLRLLEGRCRRTGSPRPRGVTPIRWLRQLALGADPTARGCLFQFARLADWSAFAPTEAAAPYDRVRDICLAAEQAARWNTLIAARLLRETANASRANSTASEERSRRVPQMGATGSALTASVLKSTGGPKPPPVAPSGRAFQPNRLQARISNVLPDFSES